MQTYSHLHLLIKFSLLRCHRITDATESSSTYGLKMMWSEFDASFIRFCVSCYVNEHRQSMLWTIFKQWLHIKYHNAKISKHWYWPVMTKIENSWANIMALITKDNINNKCNERNTKLKWMWKRLQKCGKQMNIIQSDMIGEGINRKRGWQC